MDEIFDYCVDNNISASFAMDSFYFRVNGKDYRVSNHSVEASCKNSHGEYHTSGREEDVTYIHASKTRLIDIHKLIAAGINIDANGREV
jgi:hypothetical protein